LCDNIKQELWNMLRKMVWKFYIKIEQQSKNQQHEQVSISGTNNVECGSKSKA